MDWILENPLIWAPGRWGQCFFDLRKQSSPPTSFHTHPLCWGAREDTYEMATVGAHIPGYSDCRRQSGRAGETSGLTCLSFPKCTMAQMAGDLLLCLLCLQDPGAQARPANHLAPALEGDGEGL